MMTCFGDVERSKNILIFMKQTKKAVRKIIPDSFL